MCIVTHIQHINGSITVYHGACRIISSDLVYHLEQVLIVGMNVEWLG